MTILDRIKILATSVAFNSELRGRSPAEAIVNKITDVLSVFPQITDPISSKCSFIACAKQPKAQYYSMCSPTCC